MATITNPTFITGFITGLVAFGIYNYVRNGRVFDSSSGNLYNAG